MESHHRIGMPSAVLQVECLRTHVAIIHTAVQEESGVLMKQPVGIDVEARHMVLSRIVVGGIQQVVAVVERILLDGIVRKAVTQVHIQHQLR